MCTEIHVHAGVQVQIHVHMYVNVLVICMYMYIHMYVHMYTYLYGYMYIWSMYARMYGHVNMHHDCFCSLGGGGIVRNCKLHDSMAVQTTEAGGCGTEIFIPKTYILTLSSHS